MSAPAGAALRPRPSGLMSTPQAHARALALAYALVQALVQAQAAGAPSGAPMPQGIRS